MDLLTNNARPLVYISLILVFGTHTHTHIPKHTHRYDVRGALCELTPYEAPPGGYGNRLEYLSSEEQRAEQLCEEERYLFLYNNEEELRLQQGK